MVIETQIVLDAEDPHRLGAFWAAALGFELEDNSALIRQLLDAGAAPEEATVDVDGRLAWRTIVAIRHPDDPVQEVSGAGLGRRMLFQEVPEPKSAKNRMHLDLKVGAPAMEAEVNRLADLGATVLRRLKGAGNHHVTMQDPEGNEFDVQ